MTFVCHFDSKFESTTTKMVPDNLLLVQTQASALVDLLHTGVQYLLPATWTPLRQHISLARLTELLSTAPAALAGLSDSKGKIAVGYDADLMVSTQGLVQTTTQHVEACWGKDAEPDEAELQ